MGASKACDELVDAFTDALDYVTKKVGRSADAISWLIDHVGQQSFTLHQVSFDLNLQSGLSDSNLALKFSLTFVGKRKCGHHVRLGRPQFGRPRAAAPS